MVVKDNDPVYITVGYDFSVDPPIYRVLKIQAFSSDTGEDTGFRGTREECIEFQKTLYKNDINKCDSKN